MSKKLYLVRNIIFYINIILFTVYSFYPTYNIFTNIHVILFYIITPLILIISVIDLFGKKDIANYDKKYNLIFIISNVIIMIIMLRGMFDNSIVTNVYHKIITELDMSYRMMFISNNLLYFNIIYICLILYRFTLIKKKIVK